MDYLFFEIQYVHNNISFFPMHKQVSSLWKIFQFYIENALLQVLGYYLTDFTVLDKFFSFPSLGPRLFNLLVLYRGYANLRSAHHNTRKYVGIPNWLPRASISCKTCFLHACVLFDWTYYGKWIVTCNKPSNCSFKIIFNCPSDCECTWINVVHSEVFWWSYTDLWKIYNLHPTQSTDIASTNFNYSTEQDLLEYLEEHYSQI